MLVEKCREWEKRVFKFD